MWQKKKKTYAVRLIFACVQSWNGTNIRRYSTCVRTEELSLMISASRLERRYHTAQTSSLSYRMLFGTSLPDLHVTLHLTRNADSTSTSGLERRYHTARSWPLWCLASWFITVVGSHELMCDITKLFPPSHALHLHKVRKHQLNY